jgi:hypothetical protein
MRKFLIIFILSFYCNVNSQNNELVGKWKVISVDNGEIYYNIKNDSIKIYDIIKEEYNEVSKIESLKEMTKLVYFSILFIFDENGKYQQKSDFAEFNLYYNVNKKKGVILLSDSIENFDINSSEMDFELKNNFLYLEIKDSEPSTKFILKRIE